MALLYNSIFFINNSGIIIYGHVYWAQVDPVGGFGDPAHCLPGVRQQHLPAVLYLLPRSATTCCAVLTPVGLLQHLQDESLPAYTLSLTVVTICDVLHARVSRGARVVAPDTVTCTTTSRRRLGGVRDRGGVWKLMHHNLYD